MLDWTLAVLPHQQELHLDRKSFVPEHFVVLRHDLIPDLSLWKCEMRFLREAQIRARNSDLLHLWDRGP